MKTERIISSALVEKPMEQTSSITKDQMLELYDKERAELLALSKEELVDLIIGKRHNVEILR